MSYFVINRGPLGVGKTTDSQCLGSAIGAEYISIDRILDDQGLCNDGALSEFLAANRFAAERAQVTLSRGRAVGFDGNFYWWDQIDDLLGRLPYPHYAFTLEAPLAVCTERDSGRIPPHGAEAARLVYEKTMRFDYGIKLDATRPVDFVVHEIVSHISADRAGTPR